MKRKHKFIKEMFDMGSWDDMSSSSCGCGDNSGPEMFSDAIRNMPVSELLNQIKGTDEGLYRKLVYYIRDTYHEDNKQDFSYDSPISIEDISSCDSSPIRGSVSIIRRESNSTKKGPNLDLIIEAYKAKKEIKKKKAKKVKM